MNQPNRVKVVLILIFFLRTVYVDTTSEMIESVVSGFNTTIFAYGQTSSGKLRYMLFLKLLVLLRRQDAHNARMSGRDWSYRNGN